MAEESSLPLPLPQRRARHGSNRSDGSSSKANTSDKVLNENNKVKPDQSSPSSTNTRGNDTTEGKGSRTSSRKRKSSAAEGNQICPVCGVTVRPSELEQHFRDEVQQIDQMVKRGRVLRDAQASYTQSKQQGLDGASSSKGKQIAQRKAKRKKRRKRREDSDSDASSSDSDCDGREEIDPYLLYLEVRGSRHARERRKELLQNPACNPETMLCPVCFLPLIGSEVQKNEHVESCLTGQSSAATGSQTSSAADALLDVDGEGGGGVDQDMAGPRRVAEEEDEEEEEGDVYEWMGQTRVRTISLVPGGYQGLGYQISSSRSSRNAADEDDIDLDVDGDETEEFGPQQYSEQDVLARCPPLQSSSHSAVNDVGYEDSVSDELLINGCSERGGDTNEHGDNLNTKTEDSLKTHRGFSAKGIHVVVESLKARVRELEEAMGDGRERLKCQICMGAYNVPLASIQCWHVHCEDCWMKTLASKKLCPQCQMITAPSQLRKIYL